MAPAQQRLEAGDHPGPQIDQRLIEQFELAGAQRLTEVEFQQAARLHLRVHLGLEQPIDAAAIRPSRDTARDRRIFSSWSASAPSCGANAMPMLVPMTI